MKRITLFCLFLAFFVSGIAQTDTLYTKSRKKISCKITEIGEADIKYKLPDNIDGPVYVIPVTKIYKYRLSNGQETMISLDELLVENQHQAVLNRRSAIKVHPFSYVNNQITFAYERVLTMGTNLDLEMGYVNNGIMPSTSTSSWLRNKNGDPSAMSGFYFKPGVKFLIGQDFSLKGMKFSHPLKGRFILINGVYSFMKYQDAYFFVNQSQSTIGNPGAGNFTTTITEDGKIADVNCIAYGLMINYGRQFLLGNYVTLEYYLGVGATGQSVYKTNSSSVTTTYGYSTSGNIGNPPARYYSYLEYNEVPPINNYHGFFRVPNVGLSYTLGFRLGILLPDDKDSKKPKKIEEAGQ